MAGTVLEEQRVAEPKTGLSSSVSTSDGPLTVLVVDDARTNRMILKSLLAKDGHLVHTAENGREAVEAFEEKSPDIILMDISMPVMDGYEATRIIKRRAGDRFVPVIFLTAKQDDESLARCIDCGGDDFLTKPYSKVILKAKLSALIRVRELYGDLREQRDELVYHQERLQQEHLVAEKIFGNIIHPAELLAANIKYLLSPMSIFNGDLLLAARKPSGGLHVLVGDFTGHGLSAAIGALPVSDIFYQMTQGGFSIGDLVIEMNSKLNSILPTGMFFAACLMELDRSHRTLSVWNAGSPDVIIRSADDRVRKIPSRNVPLGILPPGSLEPRAELVELEPGDRIYAYSDGVIEARNPSGDLFSQERVDAIFEDASDADGIFDEILVQLQAFRSGEGQADDMTLIEVICDSSDEEQQQSSGPGELAKQSSCWEIVFDLSAECLRAIDPLPLFLHNLVEIQGLQQHRECLFMIVAELFNNALEHGLLELDSALKATPAGFLEYYSEKERRLGELSDQSIRIRLGHEPRADTAGGRLSIQVTDSGPGFDHERGYPSFEENRAHSGRGIPLVKSLCTEFRFEDGGRTAIAVFEWDA